MDIETLFDEARKETWFRDGHSVLFSQIGLHLKKNGSIDERRSKADLEAKIKAWAPLFPDDPSLVVNFVLGVMVISFTRRILNGLIADALQSKKLIRQSSEGVIVELEGDYESLRAFLCEIVREAAEGVSPEMISPLGHAVKKCSDELLQKLSKTVVWLSENETALFHTVLPQELLMQVSVVLGILRGFSNGQDSSEAIANFIGLYS